MTQFPSMTEIGRGIAPLATTVATAGGVTAALPVGTGWRYWRLNPETGDLNDPEWGGRSWWRPGWNVAECRALSPRPPGHPAPGLNCGCGIHLVDNLGDFRAYLSTRKGGNLVFGEVQYAGRTQGSACNSDLPVAARLVELLDPPGTLRVERARLVELHAKGLRPGLRNALRLMEQRYDVPVRVA